MKQINEYYKANLINEYLSTKINIDDKKFPEEFDINKICKFLYFNKFEQIDDPNYISFDLYLERIKVKNPFYLYSKHGTLFISKGVSEEGYFTKDNALYILKDTANYEEYACQVWWLKRYDLTSSERYTFETFSKLRKYLLEDFKEFNWK